MLHLFHVILSGTGFNLFQSPKQDGSTKNRFKRRKGADFEFIHCDDRFAERYNVKLFNFEFCNIFCAPVYSPLLAINLHVII